MARVVEMHPAAEDEVEAEADRYDTLDPGRGDHFIAAARAAVARLSDEHLVETRLVHHRGLRAIVRWLPVDGYPFRVIYVDENPRKVVAVCHYRRRPGYWRKRV